MINTLYSLFQDILEHSGTNMNYKIMLIKTLTNILIILEAPKINKPVFQKIVTQYLLILKNNKSLD